MCGRFVSRADTIRPLQSRPDLIAMQSSPLSNALRAMYIFQLLSGSRPSVLQPRVLMSFPAMTTLLENVG